MPKAVSDDFQAEWASIAGRYAHWKIEYKRRYWDGAAMVEEAAAHTLYPEDIHDITPIIWKSEEANRNRQGVANVTVSIRNDAQKWLPSNEIDSIWKADDVTGEDNPYIPYWSEFVVKYAYRINTSPETFDYVPIFTGFAETPTFDSDSGAVEIVLVERAIKMERTQAEKVRTNLTGQGTTPPVGDGAVVDFDTGLKSLYSIAPVEFVAALTVSSASNDAIDFNEGGGELNATIAAGTYPVGATDADAGSVCAVVKTALEAAGAGTYSVAFSLSTKKFAITQDSGPTSPPEFNILWNSGSNKATNSASLLGYDDEDDTGALTYTADSDQFATEKNQGADYTLEDMGDADKTAHIIFTDGSTPPADTTIIWGARQWLRNNNISTTVGLLCDAAGVGSGERDVAEPIFEAVDQSHTIDSQAEWEAGTLIQNMSTTSLPGSIETAWTLVDKFTDLDFTADPIWTITYNLAGRTSFSAASGYLSLSSSGASSGIIETPLAQAYGTWSFKFTYTGSAPGTNYRGSFHFAGGYSLDFAVSAFGYNQVRLMRDTTIIASLGATDSSPHVWTITRAANDLFTVYKGGSPVGSVTDGVYTSATVIKVAASAASDAPADSVAIQCDDIFWSPGVQVPGVSDPTTDSPRYESVEIDLLAAPTQWLPLEIVSTLNGGTITKKTKVASVPGGPYDDEIEMDGSDTPQSEFKRYVIVIFEFTTQAGGSTSPSIDRSILNWRSASLFLAHSDFSNQDALAAITELATLGNMDFGFYGDGSFYFLNKSVSTTPDFELTEGNAISRVRSLKPGEKKVKNVVTVRYGGGKYFAEYTDADAGDAEPTSSRKYGDGLLPLDAGRFMFANNANIAGSMAQKAHSERKNPKREAILEGRIIPHMDLRDVSRVSWRRSPLLDKVIFGDPLQKDPPMGGDEDGPSNVLMQKMLSKTLGIEYILGLAGRPSKQVTTVEEVLT